MKTGIGIVKKIRFIHTRLVYVRFWCKAKLLGFEYALVFLRSVDKMSLSYVLSKYGADIDASSDIESGLTFHNCVSFENLKVGANSHIGKNCFLDLKDKIEIGKNCTISMGCSLITHQDMGNSVLGEIYGKTHGRINIRENAYIGVGSTVLQNVEIGNGAIVAAGSMVKDNVPSDTIVGGIPAKVLKKIKRENSL